MIKVKSFLKRFLVVLLAISITVGCFSNVVYADSVDRISAYITMASGKQISDVDVNKLNLSERDLQFLGLYISNFFVPFGTELGTNSDITSQNKEDIKNSLQTTLSFSESMASSLTDTLLGLSRSSKQDLVLCVSKEYQKGLTVVEGIPLTYYTALSCIMGGLSNYMASHFETSDSVRSGIIDGTYKYGYFAYKSGSDYIPMFDFFIKGSYITPSQSVFLKCLESVDIEKGFGLNFLDFTANELDGDEGYDKLKDKYTEHDIYSMSILGSGMSVDCFGNIIIMGGNHQYIAVPGCMNPYSWMAVNDDGSNAQVYGGGYYNMLNVLSMSLGVNPDADNSIFKSYNTDGYVATFNFKVLADKLSKVYEASDSNPYDTLTLRLIRGDVRSDLTEWQGPFTHVKTPKELIESAGSEYVKKNPTADNLFTSVVSGSVKLPVGKVLVDGSFSLSCTTSYLDNFIYVDNLGEANFQGNGSSVFSTFNPDHFLSSDGMSDVRDYYTDSSNGFKNTYEDITSGKMEIPSVTKEALFGLYFTYAWAGLYNEANKAESIGRLGYKINSEYLPSIPDKALYLSEDAQVDFVEDSIRDWVYYLLHPTEGVEYFTVWITNKLNAFLVNWHDDMVGTNGTGSINGTTRYRGFSGYITIPELSEISWTNSLLNMYNNAIPFFIVVMLLVLLGAYVVGILTFQRAVIGLVIFSMCLSLPSALINGGVGTSNRFSSSLYGEKFTYWALVQHQSYAAAIDSAASGSSYSNYLKTLFEENAQATGNQGSESIMLKWQAPKKMASLMLTENDKSIFDSLNASLLVSGLLESTYSGESYLNNKSNYLYRSYIDIANFSRYIHRGLRGSVAVQPINLNLTNDITGSWDESLKTAVSNLNDNYSADRSNGYTNVDKSTGNDLLRVKLPLSSSIVSDALADRGTLDTLGLSDYVGIDQRAFNFSIPMFTVGDLTYKSVLEADGYSCGSYTPEDYSGLAAYGLMSESVYYYFSWYLFENGLSDEAFSYSGFRNLLLGDDKAGFFYNSEGNGELKDFMDMKSLFTYVIPYLRQGNDLVREWDELYGIFLYDGVPSEEGHEDDIDISTNKELAQKYWHNVNVMRLYNMYTPWVDVMYDCSYAKEEKISYLGETYVVADPLNPASYPADRPMIFSRSEMEDYGLKEYQLTKAEKLILECQEGMQERMFKLLNYHTFSDTVLNAAASVNCAFEFNETFSENSLFGANNNIYPQSFELSDFSYDAFLRFILSNSTGDSMVVDEGESFYDNVVKGSSTTTIIVMLILDILAMYVIPGCRMLFLMMIFLSSVFIILVTAFRVDQQQKFLSKLFRSFFLPIVKFTGVTCAMALVVSWFMGEGNTSVTGAMETSIQVGDPVTVMLLMILLNCYVIYAYYKILVGVWKDVKDNGKSALDFIGNVVGSVGSAVTSGITKATKRVVGTQGGSGASSSGSSDKGEIIVNSTSVRAKERSATRSGSEERYDSKDRTSERSFNEGKKKSSTKSSVDISAKVESGMNNIIKDDKKGV